MGSVLRANEKDATLNSTNNFSASNPVPNAIKPSLSAVKPVANLSKPNFSASKSLPNVTDQNFGASKSLSNVSKPHTITSASRTSLNNSETKSFKFTSVKSLNENRTDAKLFGSQSAISSKGKIRLKIFFFIRFMRNNVRLE